MASGKELYTVLGVDPTASETEIKAAYEHLISNNPEGTANHDSIVHAYTVLSDMDSRALYDVTGKVNGKKKRKRTSEHTDRREKARYALNTLFLAGAAVTTVFFFLQWSGAVSTTPFYWACSVSLLIKISEFILRLIP